jgi:hypothetical protein
MEEKIEQFINMVRGLYNIDRRLLPELSEGQWHSFRTDPARYLIHADEIKAVAIFREVMKRQSHG